MVDKNTVFDLPPLANFETFRAWLIASTKPHGAKQRFACAAKTSPQVVSTWITRHSEPNADHLRSIAAHFDLSFPALLLLTHAGPAKSKTARATARRTLELLAEWHYVRTADAAADVIRYITARAQQAHIARKIPSK